MMAALPVFEELIDPTTAFIISLSIVEGVLLEVESAFVTAWFWQHKT